MLLTGIIRAIGDHPPNLNETSRGVYDPHYMKGLINSLAIAHSPAHGNLRTSLGRFLEDLNLSFTNLLESVP